jgi:hypothetical protein
MNAVLEFRQLEKVPGLLLCGLVQVKSRHGLFKGDLLDLLSMALDLWEHYECRIIA